MDYLATFPLKSAANAALRDYSHSALEYYKSKNEIKSGVSSILETHAFSRVENARKIKDLFIFYQHKDNCDHCSKYCFIPQLIHKLSSYPPKEKEELNNSSLKTSGNSILDLDWENKLATAEKETGLKIEPFLSSENQDSIPNKLEENCGNNPAINKLPSKLKNGLNLETRFLGKNTSEIDGIPIEVPLDYYYKPSQVVSCGDKKCEHGASFFINGVLNTYDEAVIAAQAISEMQGGNEIDLIYNSTLGLQGDLLKQKYIDDGYLIPVGKILIDRIMDYFEKADKNQILHIDAHSQGGAILNKILPEIPPEYRDRMYIDTYGTAGYVALGMAHRVRNIWHPNDIISKTADKEGWKRAKEEGTLVILENDGKSAAAAHRLMDGYFETMQENNKRFARGDF